MNRSTRAMIAAAAMAALLAGEAHAQSHNSATVSQNGENNGAAVVQNGAGNTAGIRQFGRDNTGAITQNGDNNAACLIQIGRNLDGAITQTGDYNNAGVLQTRRGATEIPVQFCTARRGNGRGVFMGIARHAVQRANR
jgi:minor curlin subunit